MTLTHPFAFARAAAVETYEAVSRRVRYCANQAGLQVTQGWAGTGLAVAQQVPELLSLYRSPDFMSAIEALTGTRILPNPNLDLGLQAYLLSTKRFIDRGRGVDGVTVFVFCDNVAARHEGAFVAYNLEGAEAIRIQPRPGVVVCGNFADIEHEIEAPLKPAACARLTYVDALKVAHKTVWGATSPEARKALVGR